MSEHLREAREAIKLITGYDYKRNMVNAAYIKDKERLDDACTVLFNLKYTEERDDADREFYLGWSQIIKKYAQRFRDSTGEKEYDDIYWRCMKFEAPELFESYLFFTESNRDPKKQFYLPRYETLHPVVKDLQELEDGKYDFYGLSMPPRVGKSTICLFFMSWIMGRRPNSHNAMSGHSGILADGFYDEMLNLLGQEYRFLEVFPCSKIFKKSAEKKEITLDMPDRFATLTCRGIEGTWTGAVDISSDGYLYVDDLVRDREESLSPQRLDGRFQDYLNVLVDRKQDGARELMVGTRWNVQDPLGRIEEKYKGNPRYKFRKLPALDQNNSSNFKYKFGKGFSTQYYQDVKDRLDNNEWMAKYQQRPYVREGILFGVDELRYYNGVLPEGDSRVVSVVDVAWGGGDSLSMPVGREYENGDIYIFDWIFNKGMKEDTLPLVCGRIKSNEIRQIQFEANNGGDMYCAYVDESLRSDNYKCSCTHQKAPAVMAKMSKIIGASGDIKRRMIFLDTKHRSAEYQNAIDELTTFVQIGKNLHDDAADSLSQLIYFVDGNANCTTATVMQSPF